MDFWTGIGYEPITLAIADARLPSGQDYRRLRSPAPDGRPTRSCPGVGQMHDASLEGR